MIRSRSCSALRILLACGLFMVGAAKWLYLSRGSAPGVDVWLAALAETTMSLAVVFLWRSLAPIWVVLAACAVACVVAVASSDEYCQCLAGITQRTSRGARLLVAGAFGLVAALVLLLERGYVSGVSPGPRSAS